MPIMEIVFLLKLSVIIIDFILFGVMLNKTLKIEFKITKKYFTGMTLFFLVHSICRTFYLIDSFWIQGSIFGLIGTILGLASVVIVVAAIESTIYTKSKHIFTIWGIVGVSVMTIGAILEISTGSQPHFGNYSLMIVAQYSTIPVLALFIVLIYFNVAIKSTGNVRTNAILMTLAIILFGLAEMGNTGDAITLVGEWITYGAPIIAIASLILLFISVSNYFKDM